MSCIRYKFKSALEFDKVTFDGLQISVADLREKIMLLKKMNVNDQFTLEIMEAQTKKVYSDDATLIPRNTSVIIMRKPKLAQQKLPKTQLKDPTLPQDMPLLSAEQLKKTGDLAGANASEEDKVRAMMSQAGEEFNPANYAKFKPRGNVVSMNVKPPPSNYICHRCGQKGHWIKFCPTNGDPAYDNLRLKRSSGIPSSHVSVAPSNVPIPGAMVDRFGNVVVRTVDLVAADSSKRKVMAPVVEPEKETIPPELTCSICKELVRDAVIIPCCAESFCDECIREYLLENDFTCYSCKESDVSPESLVPNKSLRAAATKFQSRQTKKKSIAVARGLPAIMVSSTDSKKMEPLMTSNLHSSTSSTPSSLPSNFSQETLTSLSSSLDESSAVTTTSLASTDNVLTVDTNVQSDSSHVNEVLSQQRTPSPAVIDSPVTVSSTGNSSTPPPPPIITTSAALFKAPLLPKSTITAPIVMQPPLPPPIFTNPTVTLPSLVAPALFPPLQAPPVVLPGLPLPLTGPIAGTHPFLAPRPPNPLQSAQSLDSASMARLTELLAVANNSSSRNSPPPLSMEEFYQQQKLLQDLTRGQSRSRSRSVSFSSTSTRSSLSRSSRSPSPLRSRSRSPRGQSPQSKPKSHRHHHSHKKDERMKRKRRDGDRERSEKHKHKKKKRKHSQSKLDNGEVPSLEVESQLKPQVNGFVEGMLNEVESLDTETTAKEQQAPEYESLKVEKAENGVSNQQDHIVQSKETSLLVPSSTVNDEAMTKIRKKKKHKEKRDKVRTIKDVAHTVMASAVKHHKKHKHRDEYERPKKKIKKSSKE